MDEKQLTQFYKVMNEFLKDLLIPFPEYELIIKKWWNFDEFVNDKVSEIYSHLKKLMMNQFMDILNQNVDIFHEDSTVRTDFLPQIDFKHLWNCELTDKTREMIWKYLQLILITIIHVNSNCEENMDSVLKQMDTEEIRTKLNNAVENMKNLFQNTEKDSMNDFQSQMDSLLNGKLGNLAKEMAQDTFKDLEIDPDNPLKMWDNLFKDPSQLNGLIKNIGEKLNNKMESGEVNEQDLLSESVNLFSQMKNIPGLNNFTDILNNMGNIPGINKKNMDVKGMAQKFNKLQKNEKLKERLHKKMEKKKEDKKKQDKKVDNPSIDKIMNDEEIIKLFNQK